MKCYVRENSFIARLAAWKLGVPDVAIVIGRTIHLHRARKQEFIKNTRWLRHEIAHVKQFQRYGFLAFIFMYLWEWLRTGYYNNKYESEARKAENNDNICNGIIIM